jgi:hypothetical protein
MVEEWISSHNSCHWMATHDFFQDVVLNDDIFLNEYEVVIGGTKSGEDGWSNTVFTKIPAHEHSHLEVFSFTVMIKYKEKENMLSGPVPYVSEVMRQFCTGFVDFHRQKFNQHFGIVCASKGKVLRNSPNPTLMEKLVYKYFNFDID